MKNPSLLRNTYITTHKCAHRIWFVLTSYKHRNYDANFLFKPVLMEIHAILIEKRCDMQIPGKKHSGKCCYYLDCMFQYIHYNESNLRYDMVRKMYNKKVKKIKRSLWQRICLHFILCANICSIHGFSHVVRKKISIYERALWMALIIAAVTWCVVIATEAWHHFQTRPTVVSVEIEYHNWDVPFPATTICVNSIDTTKADELIKELEISDDEAFKEFITNLATTQFEKNFDTDTYEKYPWYEQADNYLYWVNRTKHTVDDQFDIEQSFSSPLLFDTTISEIGVCFMYNSQISYYNTLEYWDLNTNKLIERKPTLTVNANNVKPSVKIDNIMGDYTIYFHGPYEIPSMTTVGITAPAATFSNFELTINSVVTPPEVKDLQISQRKCRFPDESNLKHSPIYSYNLCTIECRIKLCLKLCKCIPFYYKRIGDEKVCNPRGMKCWLKHKDLLIRLVDEDQNSVCSCIQTCNTDNIINPWYEITSWFLGTNAKWFYSEFPHFRYIRSLIFSKINLYVQIGGVVSFFLGFSILSFMEIIYFFTIRFYWAVVKGKIFNVD